MPRPSRVVGGMGLITATTTIMAGITVGTTTDIGMRGVGRTTDNPVGSDFGSPSGEPRLLFPAATGQSGMELLTNEPGSIGSRRLSKEGSICVGYSISKIE